MFTEPSERSTDIQVKNCTLPFFKGSSLTRTGADQVSPPSRDDIKNTSGSPLRASIQLTYSVPLFGPPLKSTPVTGIPFARSSPATEKSQPPGIWSITLSLPKVRPPSSDFLKIRPSGPAQTTYTSPFGPTAGTAPSTVLSLSRQSPAASEIRIGIAKVLPPSVEREK